MAYPYSKEADRLSGKKIMLGSTTAEVLEKAPGKRFRLGNSVYRVTGIYETGDAFEDGGALLSLAEAPGITWEAAPGQPVLYPARMAADLKINFPGGLSGNGRT